MASVAANSVLDRAWGKPKEFDPREVPTGGMRIDVAMLTAEQRSLLLAIVQSGAVKPVENGWNMIAVGRGTGTGSLRAVKSGPKPHCRNRLAARRPQCALLHRSRAQLRPPFRYEGPCSQSEGDYSAPHFRRRRTFRDPIFVGSPMVMRSRLSPVPRPGCGTQRRRRSSTPRRLSPVSCRPAPVAARQLPCAAHSVRDPCIWFPGASGGQPTARVYGQEPCVSKQRLNLAMAIHRTAALPDDVAERRPSISRQR